MMKKRIGCILGGVVIVVITLQMAGCRATELEERCFPLVVAVNYEEEQDAVSFCAGFPRVDNSGSGKTNELQVSTEVSGSFADSKKEYEKNLNKIPDYNHLKVLVLGEKLVDNMVAYDEMLETLAKTEEFPRNTYVCVVDDVEELLEIDKELPQDVGTYLEEFLNNHEAKKNRMLTLGDLLDEQENQDMILYAPYLEIDDSYVEWGGYYAIGLNVPPEDLE